MRRSKRKKLRPSNQGTTLATSRTYTRQTIDPALSLLIRDHVTGFERWYNAHGNQNPQNDAAIREAKKMIREYQKMLDLMYQNEQLANLKEDFFDVHYFRLSYRLKIAVIKHHLGEPVDEIKTLLETSFKEAGHATLIKSYAFLRTRGLLEEENPEYPFYLHQLIESLVLYSHGSESTYKEELRSTLNVLFGVQDVQTAILNMSQRLLTHYFQTNDKEKIKSLFSLYPRKYHDIRNDLLFRYHIDCIFKGDSETIAELLVTYEKDMTDKQYQELASKSKLFAPDALRIQLRNTYIEKGIALHYPLCEVYSIANIIYEEPEPSNIALVIPHIQAGIEAKVLPRDVRAKYAHLMGRIYDLGLSANPKFSQSDSKAFSYYRQAYQFDNTAVSTLQDLATMYQSGQGTSQDLAEAFRLLSRITNPPVEVLYQLALTRQMQTAECNSEEKEGYIRDALMYIEKAIETLSRENTGLSEMSIEEFYLIKASILLAIDMPFLRPIRDAQTQKIIFSYDFTDLEKREKTSFHSDNVRECLELSSQVASPNNANYLLGFLYHRGSYFEQDLDKAEYYYLLYQQENGVMVPELVDLYLLKIEEAEGAEEFILKAVNQCHKCSENKASWETFDDMAVQLIQYYRAENKKSSPSFVSSFTHSKFELKARKEESYYSQVETNLAYVNRCLLHFNGNEEELLDAAKKLSFVLKRTRTQVLSYKRLLPSLAELENALVPFFAQLGVSSQCELLQQLSGWPLLKAKEGAFSQMLSMLDLSSLNAPKLIYLAHSVVNSQHTGGLFMAHLQRLMSATNEPLTDIHDVARFIHFYAIVHANTRHLKENPLLQLMTPCLESLWGFINEHCWEVDMWSMSELYFSIPYLEHVHPSLSRSKNLDDFMAFNDKLISCDEAVSPSYSQKQMFEQLQKMDPETQLEPLLCGRRVDCFSPKYGVLEFNGPQHYYTTTEGKRSRLKSNACLTIEALKTAHPVFVVHYNEWPKSPEQQLSYLNRLVHPSLAQEQKLKWTKNNQILFAAAPHEAGTVPAPIVPTLGAGQ